MDSIDKIDLSVPEPALNTIGIMSLMLCSVFRYASVYKKTNLRGWGRE